MKAIFRTVLLVILPLVLVAGCGRFNYYKLLSERGIERLYLGPQDTTIHYDIEAQPSALVERSYLLTVPQNTNLQTLKLSFENLGFALFVDGEIQISGSTPNNFTHPLNYRAYSYDGRYDDYVVSVQLARAWLDSFAFTQSDNPGFTEVTPEQNDIVFSEAQIKGNTIDFFLSHSLSLSGLRPSFHASENSGLTPDIKLVKDGEATDTLDSASHIFDFSKPEGLVLRVIAPTDNSFLDYRIRACRLVSLAFDGGANGFGDSARYEAHLEDDLISVEVPMTADLSRLTADVSFLGDTLTVDGEPFESGKTVLDFSESETTPLVFRVGAASGTAHSYRVRVVKNANPYNEPNNPVSPGNEPNNPVIPFEDTTGPGPARVTKLSTTTTSASIEWENPADEDFDHVIISCNGQSISSTANAETVSGLSAPNTYPLTITAYDTSGNASTPASVTAVIDGTHTGEWLLIYTAEDLNAVRGGNSDPKYALWGPSKNYQLMNKIDLKDTAYDPWPRYDATFTGYFCGNDYRVTCEGITGTVNNVAFFTQNSGTIHSLRLDVTTVSVTGTFNYAAILCADNAAGGVIENCYVKGTVDAAFANNVGGLCGVNSGTLEGCTAAVTVSGKLCVGGLCGSLAGSSVTVENCEVSGSVTGSNFYVGGLIGSAGGTGTHIINDCHTQIEVDSSSNYVGGLIGYISATYTITSCSARGSVSGFDDVGGLIGNSATYNSEIEECSAENTIVEGRNKVGGFVGSNTGKIILSYATGDVTGTDNCTGGFVGLNDGAQANISQCYATGDVTSAGLNYTGGFVGSLENGKIENCYARGRVTGMNNVGGFAGQILNGTTVEFCYATGGNTEEGVSSTNGSLNIGGFYGYHISATVTSCLFDSTTTGKSSQTEVDGQTTDLMQLQETYTSLIPAWNFSTIWSIGGGLNDDYPWLTNLPPE